MNLYEFEEHADNWPVNRKGAKPLRDHRFEFNRQTRRMVCSVCDGKMNECNPACPGSKQKAPSV